MTLTDLTNTAAHLDQRGDDGRRDLLLISVQKGLANSQRFLRKGLPGLADYPTLAAGRYGDEPSTVAKIKKHDARLFGWQCRVDALAASTTALREIADAAGVTGTEFDELGLLTEACVTHIRLLRDAWELERARVLRQSELENIGFVALVNALGSRLETG